MPQCSEFEAMCFRYVITIFGSPTVGLYERNAGRLHVDFIVLSVMIISALFDVLTSMLLRFQVFCYDIARCRMLNVKNSQWIVVSSFSVSLF
jgi:hypothetical protein